MGRDPTRTVHFLIADALEQRMRRSDDLPTGYRRPSFAAYATDPTNVDRRDSYVLSALYAWFALGAAIQVAAVAIGAVLTLIFDEKLGQNVAIALLALGMFCYAGGINALWRKAWYVPQARRRLSKYGPDSPKFATSMQRISPPNTTLIVQTAAAVLTLVAVY
jgi:hypothetical protein